eukprot:scaffold50724_cov45-Phaeocystis_antarctica.AAC.2
MVSWHRAGRHGAGRRGAGRSQAAARWALRLMWRTWVGVASLMRVPDEGGDRRVPDTSAKVENQLFSARPLQKSASFIIRHDNWPVWPTTSHSAPPNRSAGGSAGGMSLVMPSRSTPNMPRPIDGPCSSALLAMFWGI